MTVIDQVQVRARSVVLRHARDDADAAELLNMLGLGDAQQDNIHRGRSRQACRQLRGVHAVSAATEARLAATTVPAKTRPAPAPAAPPPPPAVVPEPAPPSRPRPAAERRCEGCGNPVIQQTRYKLDPAGYRARGFRLLAAKNRCHPCYNRLRRSVPVDLTEPENPRLCGKCDRPMVTARVYDADPARWRQRGWAAHAARGLCRTCSAIAAKRRQQAVPEVQVLCGLSNQLGALRQALQGRLVLHPDNPDLSALWDALATARTHLDAARARAGGVPNQGGDR